MRARVLICTLLLLVCSLPARAGVGTIVLAWDRAGEVCNANIPLFTADTLYVLAEPGTFGPLVGAEFQVTGFPMEWSGITVTPNPAANISIGSPLTEGCNITFPTGQTGVVLLYSIAFFSTSVVSERVIGIAQRATTPSLPCPILVCDDVFWCGLCAETRSASINHPSFCSVGVDRTTWSRVRGLYR